MTLLVSTFPNPDSCDLMSVIPRLGIGSSWASLHKPLAIFYSYRRPRSTMIIMSTRPRSHHSVTLVLSVLKFIGVYKCMQSLLLKWPTSGSQDATCVLTSQSWRHSMIATHVIWRFWAVDEWATAFCPLPSDSDRSQFLSRTRQQHHPHQASPLM